MTRKDYITIAEAFNSTYPSIDTIYHEDGRVSHHPLAIQWRITRTAIADALAKDNPQFDRGRFYKACEGSKA